MFCNSLEAEERGELEDPDKAFVEAVEEPEAGEAALRAAVWATTVRILANNWPGRLDEAFEGAQSVLPLEERDVRLVRELGELTTGTATRGQLFRFSHLSLEWIMRAALGEEPEAILPSVTLWTPCFIHGLKEASEHLADLEEANPDMVVPD